MTTQDSFCSHDQAFDRAMNLERIKGIFGAGGMIPAGFGKGRRNNPLVNLYGDGQKGDQEPANPPYQEETVYLIGKMLKPGHTLYKCTQI
jgi:hypothetical protein